MHDTLPTADAATTVSNSPDSKTTASQPKLGTLYGVGIGPGDPELVTLKGIRTFASCDTIFTVVSAHVDASTSESVVRTHCPDANIVRLSFSMSRNKEKRDLVTAANARRILEELEQGRSCAYATLGDTLSYSTYGYMVALLRKVHPDLRIETVPGVTSWSTLAAEAGLVLVENTETLRVVPSFKSEMAETIDFPKGTSTILLKTYHSRRALVARLRREKDIEVVYAEKLTSPDQFISRDLDEIDAREDCYLSLMLVRSKG